MISAENLLVFFENMLALNNVSVSCQEGQIVGVFGANSAGKSTLMNVLSGIILDIVRRERMRGGERISVFGRILLDGQPIDELPASERARRGLILCPERRRLFAESSVMENLAIGGHLASRQERRDTLDQVMELFPALVALRRRPAGFLSGGEQQMVAIARALMAQPRILLLDEPLLGLAPAIQSSLVAAIETIRTTRNIGVLVTEQYARPVLPSVDTALILESGSVVLDGPREEVMSNPDVRAAYFGT